MGPFLTAVAEVGHYSAALPLLVCLALQLSPHRDDPSPDAWLLAAAFFVSFVADQIGAALAAQGRTNWWLGYIYAPLQFGLFAAVVTQHRAVRAVAIAGIGVLGAVSLLRGTLGFPETMVQVVGGLLTGWLVLGVPHLAPFRGPILVYCVAAIPWLLLMVAVPLASPWWPPAWVAYQMTRVVALGWMAVVLVGEEVPHARPRAPQDPAQRGGRVRDSGRRDRDVVETAQR